MKNLESKPVWMLILLILWKFFIPTIQSPIVFLIGCLWRIESFIWGVILIGLGWGLGQFLLPTLTPWIIFWLFIIQRVVLFITPTLNEAKHDPSKWKVALMLHSITIIVLVGFIWGVVKMFFVR